MANSSLDKSAWRKLAKDARATLTIDSAGHCDVLARFLAAEVAPGRVVVTFDAMPGEVDLSSLLTVNPDPASRYAVTRTPAEGHRLTIHPVGGETEMHRFGYNQPVATAPVVEDHLIGAVLVPALAFDRTGARLGRGMGYYDRFLGRLSGDALLIGVTGGYIVDELPTESFDVPMTHLATAESVRPVPVS